MKRVALWGILIAFLIAVVAIGLARGRAPLEQWIRADVAASIAADVSIGDLRLSFVPPRVTISEVKLERGGMPLLNVDRLIVDLLPLDSLWEGSWVGDITVESPRIEVRPGAPAWKHVIEHRQETLQWRRVLLQSVEADVALEDGSFQVTGALVEIRRSGLFEPRMHFSASGALTARRGERSVAFERASLSGEMSSGRVRIRNSLLYGPVGLIRWDGVLRDEGMRVDGSWQMDGSRLGSLAPELADRVEGRSEVRFHLSGRPADPTAQVSWKTAGMNVRGLPLSGEARATLREGRWRIRARDLSLAGGRVTLDGEGDADFGGSFRAAGRFEGCRLGVLGRSFDVEALEGRLDGEVHLSGTVSLVRIDGRTRLTVTQGDTTLDGEGQFERRPGTVRLQAKLRDRFGNHGDFEASVEEDRLDGRLRLDVPRLAGLQEFLPELDIGGSGSLEARLSGTPASPRGRGRAELRELVLVGVSVGSARATLDVQPYRVEIAELEIPEWRTRGRGRVALDGEHRNDWSLETDGLPLGRLRDLAERLGATVPPIDGRLQATVEVHGSWATPGVHSDFRVADVRLLGRSLGVASGVLRHEPGSGWALRADLHHPVDGSAVVHGRRDPQGRFFLKAHATAWRFAQMLPEERPWRDLEGRLRVDASLRGRWPAIEGELLLEVAPFSLGRRNLEPLRLTLDFGGSGVRIEGTLGERLRLDGELALPAPHPFRWRVSWEDLDLGPWVAPPLRFETSGSGRLEGDVRSPLREGVLEVEELVAGGEHVRLRNADVVVLRVRRGVIDIEPARLTTGSDSMTFSGRLAPAESVLRLEGRTDLALVETAFPEFGSTRGTVIADIELTRSGDGTWRPRGEMRVSDGVLDLGYSVGVTDVAGEAFFDGEGMDLREVRGRVGGGMLRLDGRIDRKAVEIAWKMDEARLGVPLWLDYQLSGAGTLEGPLSEPTLSGELKVVQAIYDRRFEWTELLPWVRGQIRPARQRARLPVRLDLKVTADGGVYVENNLVQAELRGDLGVGGTVADPVWSGELEVLDGTFRFRDREFNVTTGTVRFRRERPRNPSLRFLGETVVVTEEAEYDIQLRVGGTVEKPEVRLTSEDPTLTENDVLALVTFGRTVAQIQSRGTGAGIALEDVLALTAGSYGRQVERGVYRILPVDRIEIEPAFTASTGTVEPRFSIGKELMENFRAVLRSGLGAERGQDVALEYQLTRRVSLQGSWESRTASAAGTFAGDLRLRFSFWRSPDLTMFRDLFRTGEGK